MLQEPMMEKLTAMRLLGMVDALKTQEQDPASRELSFLERLGLLVDQQWTWRENQALARRLHAAKLKGACVEEIDYRASRGLDKSVIRALAQKSAWVTNHENIFVLGPTGVGKSFVACALAQKACRDGCSALYTRAAALFRDCESGVLYGKRFFPLHRMPSLPVPHAAQEAKTCVSSGNTIFSRNG